MFGRITGRVGKAGGVGSARRAPSFTADFTASGAAGDSRVSVSRVAGGATYFDQTGTLQLANANTQRIDYGYLGGSTALGLLIEEQRVNSIRNPRAEGAAAGTPGTMPTDWGLSTPAGITTTIVGSGYEQGVPYVDITFSGSDASGLTTVLFENAAIIAASNAQTWATSLYYRIVGGSLTNIVSFQLGAWQMNSTPTFLATILAGAISNPSAAALPSQRVSGTYTTNQATIASLRPVLIINFSTTLSINLTLRIGLPQTEVGAFTTSPILPAIASPAATTRGNDICTAPITPWYKSGSVGSFAADFNIPQLSPAGRSWGISSISDGTLANEIRMRIAGGGATAVIADILNASAAQGGGQISSGNAWTVGSGNKAAMSWGASSYAASLNGGTVFSGSGAISVPALTTLELGLWGDQTNSLSGWLKRLRYWPRQLSNAELIAVST